MKKRYLLIIPFLFSGCQHAQELICNHRTECAEIPGDMESEDSTEDSINEPNELKTITIVKRDITSEKTYPASIEGRKSIKIIPRIDGYLSEIRIKEGEQVQRGQVLFVLEHAAYQAEVSVAKANVSMAKSSVISAQLNFESRKNLRDKNIISEHEFLQSQAALETAKAQLEQANAQLEVAQNNLSYAYIKSPSDGVVGRLPYRVGDYIGPSLSDGLTMIADTKEMYIYFSLTEKDIVRHIAKHGSMQAMIDAFPAIKLQHVDGSLYNQTGRIETISGVIDAQTGTLSIRAAFPNPDGRLLSGGAGKLIVPEEYHQVIVIPQTATYEILDKIHVYKVVDGRAKSNVVRVIPISDGQSYVVTDGLIEGDVIVAAGASYIHENDEIQTETGEFALVDSPDCVLSEIDNSDENHDENEGNAPADGDEL